MVYRGMRHILWRSSCKYASIIKNEPDQLRSRQLKWERGMIFPRMRMWGNLSNFGQWEKKPCVFFLVDFLPRLRTFPITTMINVNIVCFCCSSITRFQTFNLLYNYWSLKVLQSSFPIVHISHQNNNEWENLPLVLLNNKQMKVISTITMKWHWSLISYHVCSSTMKDVFNAAPA